MLVRNKGLFTDGCKKFFSSLISKFLSHSMSLHTGTTDSIVLCIGGVVGELVGLGCELGCLGLHCFFSFVNLFCFYYCSIG